MATITEDYVSFEVAKLLKEKGFDVPTDHFYSPNGDIQKTSGLYPNCETNITMSAPTIQIAMKWLREEKGIAAVPILSSVLDNEKFLWDIEITVAKTNESYHQGWIYESYERDCEVAIKYVLENLI